MLIARSLFYGTDTNHTRGKLVFHMGPMLFACVQTNNKEIKKIVMFIQFERGIGIA